MKNPPGKVYLVGAGCGSADLITVRGLRLLRNCDAVICDDLIDNALLSEVRPGTEVVFMGKRQGKHSATQATICDELIRQAQTGKTVVRLKGGDPFVFGRGGEELEALRNAGIPCEVVPGVTSAVAIPGMAGIPVTFRKVSQQIHIITGHTADTPDMLPKNLGNFAKTAGTFIFLMGFSRLELIVDNLLSAGMSRDTPAAVISGGNAPHPMCIRGTLDDIASRTRSAGMTPPAVIVVGEVAGLGCSSDSATPLDRVLVGVSGSSEMIKRLRAAFEDLGAHTFIAQQSVLTPLPLSDRFESFLPDAPWLVFTSRNGVNIFFEELVRQKVDLRRLASCRFAVVGPATEAALRKKGFNADVCPSIHTTNALAQALLDASPPDAKLILLRSEQGSPELQRTLEDADRDVYDVHLYTMTPAPQYVEGTAEQLRDADYLVFTSAGGVRMFLDRHGEIPTEPTCVCIGNVTKAAAENGGAKRCLVASDTSVDKIVKAVLSDRNGARS